MVKVLIADDHPVVRSGLKAMIEGRGDMAVVGEARDADEAAQLARELHWDVAVIDFTMPGSDGVQLVQRIRQTRPTRPVLVVSMHPERLHATQAMKAGAAGYLNKETADEELSKAIRKVVNGGKYVTPAFAEALAEELSKPDDGPPHKRLSERELRVMLLLAEGKAINEIAGSLSISPSTVSTYRLRILKKLQMTSNADIVRYAARNLPSQ